MYPCLSTRHACNISYNVFNSGEDDVFKRNTTFLQYDQCYPPPPQIKKIKIKIPLTLVLMQFLFIN